MVWFLAFRLVEKIESLSFLSYPNLSFLDNFRKIENK